MSKYIVLVCFMNAFLSLAQVNVPKTNCSFSISGSIEEAESAHSLEFTSVFIKELNIMESSDEKGAFSFQGICAGQYTLIVSHFGFRDSSISLYVNESVKITLSLHHHENVLSTIIINEKKETEMASQIKEDIKGMALLKTRGLSLGESLKEITGVSSLQTGPSISKPMIHGLHSNRVLILNNGVRHEGQQWGAEHAPEIDPFIADKVTVIKGAASIRYGSDAIGGVVLLEPSEISCDQKVHGEVILFGASNNAMAGTSGKLEGIFKKKQSEFSWRMQGTLKKAANSHAANYYLNNTAFEEGNFSLTLSHHKKNTWNTLYVSQFNSKMGIFSGSHVGNLSDLQSAITRSEPRDEDKGTLSYAINRSYQQVKHSLLTYKFLYQFNEASHIEANYALQQNRRSEYDVSIPYTSNPKLATAPQLDLTLLSNTADVSWFHKIIPAIRGQIGLNGITQSNVYEGIRFLIPNYQVYSGGIFGLEKWTYKNLVLEAGIRYDYRWLQVFMLDANGNYSNPVLTYQNTTSTAGAYYRINKHWSANINYGSAWRAPNVSELFMNGVHQSAAAYEMGDVNLKVEKANNFSSSLKLTHDKIHAELGVYSNTIHNFIYSQPTLQSVVLISGTYPLFRYTQANVVFKGIDLNMTVPLLKKWTYYSKTALIWAYNKSINDYLIYTPANRTEHGVKYTLSNFGKIKNGYLTLSDASVAQQTRVPANSDYTAPPAAYNLLNAEAGFDLLLNKTLITFSLRGLNLMNTVYRDYLNRFRYYSPETGRNILLQIKITF